MFSASIDSNTAILTWNFAIDEFSILVYVVYVYVVFFFAIVYQVASYYVKCPCHGTALRSCVKQYSRGTRDEILRALMYWLVQGQYAIQSTVKVPAHTTYDIYH